MCELVEVYSVTYKGGGGAAPSGTISVFDGKRGQIIYRGPAGSAAQIKQTSQLLLTGPYRAISADGCVAFEIDLQHDCKDRAPYVAQILLDVYDPCIEYDEIVMKEAHTCTCKNSPSVEVRYALLSDAVEAIVEVKLLRKPDDHPVYGKIIARSDLGEVVLLDSADDEVGLLDSTDDEVGLLDSTDDKVALLDSTDDKVGLLDSTDDKVAILDSTDDKVAILDSTDDKVALLDSTDDKVSLLDSTDDKVGLLDSTDDKVIIPLTRSVLAMPLMSSLKIEVDLFIRSTGESIKDFVRCISDLDREDRLGGQNGKVEVKITWSD